MAKAPRQPENIECPICERDFRWEPSPKGGRRPRFCGASCKLVEDSILRLQGGLLDVEQYIPRAAAKRLKGRMFRLAAVLQRVAESNTR